MVVEMVYLFLCFWYAMARSLNIAPAMIEACSCCSVGDSLLNSLVVSISFFSSISVISSF